MQTPGGLGPWFVCLFFNTSTKCKKQTHILSHTLPHLYLDLLNRSYQPGSENFWVLMMKVGPFEWWDDSLSFLQLWTDKTRGRERRVERGFELFYAYQSHWNLTLWLQPRGKDEVIKEFMENRFVFVPPASAGGTKTKTKEKTNVLSQEWDKSFLTVQDVSQVRFKRIKTT